MSSLKVKFNHLNAWVYDRTQGRVGGSFGGHRVLLLTTTGRTSGLPRRTPVQYEEVDGEKLIVAAAGGAPEAPQWFRNIEADPGVMVQTGGRLWSARAKVAEPGERDELWRRLIELNPLLDKVQIRAGREIPVVRLVPAGEE